MNDEYLWDKSGEDPEIAALELQLSAFRMKPVPPPVVVGVSKKQLERARPRSNFFWPVWIPSAALTVLVLGWFLVVNKTPKTPVIVNAQALAPSPTAEKPGESMVPPATVDRSGAPRPTRIGSATKPEKLMRKREFIRRRETKSDKHIRPSVREQKVDESLTAEEKFAYDQLMLALSITGSKLRIVQDKIRRNDLPAGGGK